LTAYLVRHAKAGDRSDWEGDDRLRPLSRPGSRQALGLVELLKGAQLKSVLSSPYLRCIQTVEPVAQHFALRVEQERMLAEGAGGESVRQVIRKRAGVNTVLCSHGDVIQEFLELLAEEGLVSRKGISLEKGSTWVVEEDGGRIVNTRYLPPPA
jgi:8-oxo-dGTP diphosphatase